MKAGRVYVSPGFVFMAVLGMLWMDTGMVVWFALAIILHEGAHIFLLSLFGGRLRALRLTLKGAQILTEQGGMGYGGELVAVMAGPGVNLLLAVLSARAGEAFYLFAGINLILGIFNLLPFPGLDGGRMLWLLFMLLSSDSDGEK